ncbi:MAG: type VI secretion system baseplate subunit TssE [Proteobacteria bacterium]|nr:type VI secretion system baseplate subunit TssE [Pseudomonadota bacterium]
MTSPFQIEPKPESGAIRPLFDRLIDEDPFVPTEPLPKRYYNQQQAISSIIQDVERLLNTRSSARRDVYKTFIDNPLNKGLPFLYGLAEYTYQEASSPQSWWRISKLCKKALDVYEPRLKNVKVTVDAFDTLKQALKISIQADLTLLSFQGQVNFAMFLSVPTK